MVSDIVGEFFIRILAVAAVAAVALVLRRTKALFLGGVLGLLPQQGLAVGLRDLIVIGMDFREGQEAVAVTAVIDERRLK